MMDRMVRSARLDPQAYEEVERDVGATGQAAMIVLAVAIATGIGRMRDDGIGGLIVGIISAFVGWIVWSFLTYWIGKTFLKTANTRVTPGEMLRTLGFARSPGVLNFLGIIPGLGVLVLAITSIWSLIAGVIGIRQALDFSTGRAIGTGLLALIPAAILQALILAIPNALL